MSPRNYKMVKRAAALEQTRARIVAATVQAHRDLGIQATSWDEIACRAGVGVGTVYRHFPSLEELLPACGQIVQQTMALPTGEEIARAFDGARSRRARINRLVQLVFDIYERAAPFIHNIQHEREHLPQLEPWHEMIERTLDALLAEALHPLNPDRRKTEAARALIDLSTWQALKRRNLTHEETIDTVATIIHTTVRTANPPAKQTPPAPDR
jgi:AcrR family transcriptional regulator